MSNRAINRRAYWAAYKRQKFRGDSPEMTAFRSYSAKHERKSQYANLSAYPRSAFPARCRRRRRGLSNDDQEPPALPQTVPTDAASLCCTTTGGLERVSDGLSLRYRRMRKRMGYGRGQFPRMRIRIRAQGCSAVLCCMRRGFAL